MPYIILKLFNVPKWDIVGLPLPDCFTWQLYLTSKRNTLGSVLVTYYRHSCPNRPTSCSPLALKSFNKIKKRIRVFRGFWLTASPIRCIYSKPFFNTQIALSITASLPLLINFNRHSDATFYPRFTILWDDLYIFNIFKELNHLNHSLS